MNKMKIQKSRRCGFWYILFFYQRGISKRNRIRLVGSRCVILLWFPAPSFGEVLWFIYKSSGLKTLGRIVLVWPNVSWISALDCWKPLLSHTIDADFINPLSDRATCRNCRFENINLIVRIKQRHTSSQI